MHTLHERARAREREFESAAPVIPRNENKELPLVRASNDRGSGLRKAINWNLTNKIIKGTRRHPPGTGATVYLGPSWIRGEQKKASRESLLFADNIKSRKLKECLLLTGTSTQLRFLLSALSLRFCFIHVDNHFYLMNRANQVNLTLSVHTDFYKLVSLPD
jgi:hypothetical protein